LKIEGNSLTEDQITAFVANKRVVGAEKDILEVKNAIEVYDKIETFNPYSSKSFLKAHKMFMNSLVENPGKYRSQSVGIFQGSQITHLAPPAQRVPLLMNDLFQYLNKYDDIPLIKSCVFHYEMEFIHPFLDGNGRMGRFWQTLILLQEHIVFENLPFEILITRTQREYYKALEVSDKNGNSTEFIEYMLNVIDKSLIDLLDYNNKPMSAEERLDYYLSLGKKEFTRKNYMDTFKNISSSTATRDLAKGVLNKKLEQIGKDNKTKYKPTT